MKTWKKIFRCKKSRYLICINFAKFSVLKKLGLLDDAKLKKNGSGMTRVQIFLILRLSIKILAVLISRPY